MHLYDLVHPYNAAEPDVMFPLSNWKRIAVIGPALNMPAKLLMPKCTLLETQSACPLQVNTEDNDGLPNFMFALNPPAVALLLTSAVALLRVMIIDAADVLKISPAAVTPPRFAYS